MCGRFVITSPPAAIRQVFGYSELPNFPSRYNIAPTQPIPVVILENGARHFRLMRWGLIPAWVKDPRTFSLVINARRETVLEKPAFKNAIASATDSVAVGTLASATFANSTAIGNGATTTRANQQSFGTATNTYTMSGITSAASLAAQTGPIRAVTTDANGNLATAAFASQQDISGLQSSVSALQGQIRQAFEGTAIAVAMGGGTLPDNKKFAISTNWGHFRGENAASLTAMARISQNVVFNGGIAAGFQQGGVAGRAGVTYAW